MFDVLFDHIIGNLVYIQILLMASVGSLIGEMQREVSDDVSMDTKKFIVHFLSSSFLAYIIAILLKVYVIKENFIVLISVTGGIGYLGQKKSYEIFNAFLDKLLDAVIDLKNESNKNDDNSKDGDKSE